MKIGGISVEISADDKDLKNGLKGAGKAIKKFDDKTRGHLLKNEKQWNKYAKKVTESLNKAGRAAKDNAGLLSTSVAVAGAAFVAFAESVAASNRELETLARQANMTVDEFRAMSFATGTVGVNAEQFSAQLEDMRRKLAEFGRVGTGPFQDYADAMGITKDEARKLATELSQMSGEDALQTIASNMESAGVSVASMGQVLDALGSDMDRLIPLLEKGGAKAEELKSKFSGLTVAIANDDIESFQKLSESLDILTDNFKAFLADALSPLAPMFESATIAAAKFFKSLTEESRKTDEIAEKQAEIDEILNKRIGSGRRARSMVSKEVKEAEKLRKVNEELQSAIDSAIAKTESRRQIVRKKGRKWLEANEAASQKRIADNQKQIEQLTLQSAELQKIAKLRAEIANIEAGVATPSQAAETGGAKTPKAEPASETSGIVAMTREETDSFISALRDRLGKTQENLAEAYALEQQMLEQAVEQGAITRKEADQRKLDLAQEYWNNLLAIDLENDLLKQEKTAEAEEIAYQNRLAALTDLELAEAQSNAIKEKLRADHVSRMEKIEKDKDKKMLAGTKSALKNTAALMNTGNKTLFEIGKTAAIANALINAKESVVSAYAAGSEVGGPIVGAAFATAAAAAQAANIASISSQSFGGGGSPTSYSSGVPTVNTSSQQEQASATPATQSRTVNITLVGETQSTDSVRELIERINEETGDGFTLNQN